MEENELAEKITKAEIRMVSLIADRNMSINATDTAMEAFKEMFDDSLIAAKFSCKRTKAAAMIYGKDKDQSFLASNRRVK